VRKRTLTILFLLFVGLNIFLSFNFHSHGSRHSYHGALWADRAGYFIYLPAAFHYGFSTDEYPNGIDTLTGGGFSLDAKSKKVRTKYTLGVALLQSPFYMLFRGATELLGAKYEPFEDVDHAVVLVAGPVYSCLGLVLLYLIFRRTARDSTTLFLLVILYAGSNLFYYTIGDPGMSHVYSFFLFASLLFQLNVLDPFRSRRHHFALVGATLGLIVLIRPTNLIFVAAAILLSNPLHLWRMLSWRSVLFTISAGCIIWLPQLLYWKFAFGSFLTWPYTGEGFTELTSPHFAKFLFSTNNGVIPYTPLFLLFIVGGYILWTKGNQWIAGVYLTTFLSIVFLGASWWVWHFGCGYGSRTLVEFIALFAPALFTFHGWMEKQGAKIFSVIILSLIVVMQLKMTYSYGSCWFHGDWNWQAYTDLVFGPTK